MAFTVSTNNIDNSEVIVLKESNSSAEAEVYAFGGLLNSFSIQKNSQQYNVVEGFDSPSHAMKTITDGFKSAKLSPFVCRLEKGAYTFDGQSYVTNKFFIKTEAIHGLLYDATYIIKEKGADDHKAFVKLEYHYDNKTEGFPFSLTIEITYTLEAGNKLSLETKITNTGDTAMPLSDGWHPYFKLGETVNDLKIRFNSDTMMEFDERLLPSGNKIPDARFETMVELKDTFLDNCFLLKNDTNVSCILKDENEGIQLNIFADASYPYLQVYTPPHRKSIAVENLSSVPDAFNNGIGLIVSNPGDISVFKTTYQLVEL